MVGIRGRIVIKELIDEILWTKKSPWVLCMVEMTAFRLGPAVWATTLCIADFEEQDEEEPIPARVSSYCAGLHVDKYSPG